MSAAISGHEAVAVIAGTFLVLAVLYLVLESIADREILPPADVALARSREVPDDLDDLIDATREFDPDDHDDLNVHARQGCQQCADNLAELRRVRAQLELRAVEASWSLPTYNKESSR